MIPSSPRPPLYYSDYLNLKSLLNSQNPISDSHDEMLFIVIHQAYELWFKQILFEVDSAMALLSQPSISETDVAVIVARLERVTEIQKLLIQQIGIIETMTPQSFLDFRDRLNPASGFQSVQFKELEIKLGLRYEDRKLPFASASAGQNYFYGRLNSEDQKFLIDTEKKKNLSDWIEAWLERLPIRGLQEFWKDYEKAVIKMLSADREIIRTNPYLQENERKLQIAQYDQTEAGFSAVWNKVIYEEQRKQGLRRLSHLAFQNALFIFLYQSEPLLQMPFRLLNRLIEVDELFTTWRYRHALMAHRLLGLKIGTGGSSGHDYLKASAEHSRVFRDLFGISTYLLPEKKLPILSTEIKQMLGFSTKG